MASSHIDEEAKVAPPVPDAPAPARCTCTCACSQPKKKEHFDPKTLPFADFLQYVAFVASIGVALGVSSALATRDPYSIACYSYGTALFGGSLAIGLAGQLIQTSPDFAVWVLHPKPPGIRGFFFQKYLLVMAFGGILCAMAAMLAVAEGLKSLNRPAGQLLQGLVGGVAGVTCIPWVVSGLSDHPPELPPQDENQESSPKKDD